MYMEETLKSRFLKVYSNLPLEERQRPIVFIDDAPISWIMASREISEETDLGKKILNKLVELGFI